MRKSLTIIVKAQIGTKGYYDILDQNKSNQNAALNGTAYCLTILTGLQPFTK